MSRDRTAQRRTNPPLRLRHDPPFPISRPDARFRSTVRAPGRPIRTVPCAVSVPHSEHSRWFSEEVQPHESALRAYLRANFPSLSDVDDLVQESYVRLIRARAAGRVNYAKALLFTIARNIALDLFRRRKVVTIETVGNLAELSVLEDKPDAADVAKKQEELQLLAEAVRQLPDRCRQVLTLRLLYGLSHKEIAGQLGISEHTVKAQLAKGMRRCAAHFEAHGLVRSAVREETVP